MEGNNQNFQYDGSADRGESDDGSDGDQHDATKQGGKRRSKNDNAGRDFKCKYCCSIALFFCWGTTHFCNDCHNRAGNNEVKPCAGKGKTERNQGA